MSGRGFDLEIYIDVIEGYTIRDRSGSSSEFDLFERGFDFSLASCTACWNRWRNLRRPHSARWVFHEKDAMLRSRQSSGTRLVFGTAAFAKLEYYKTYIPPMSQARISLESDSFFNMYHWGVTPAGHDQFMRSVLGYDSLLRHTMEGYDSDAASTGT